MSNASELSEVSALSAVVSARSESKSGRSNVSRESELLSSVTVSEDDSDALSVSDVTSLETSVSKSGRSKLSSDVSAVSAVNKSASPATVSSDSAASFDSTFSASSESEEPFFIAAARSPPATAPAAAPAAKAPALLPASSSAASSVWSAPSIFSSEREKSEPVSARRSSRVLFTKVTSAELVSPVSGSISSAESLPSASRPILSLISELPFA